MFRINFENVKMDKSIFPSQNVLRSFNPMLRYANYHMRKLENPVTFICVGTSHKGVTQIKQMNYIQRII